jgi:hypothetical protein
VIVLHIINSFAATFLAITVAHEAHSNTLGAAVWFVTLLALWYLGMTLNEVPK